MLNMFICLENQKNIARYIGKHPKRTLATENVWPTANPRTIDNATTDDSFFNKGTSLLNLLTSTYLSYTNIFSFPDFRSEEWGKKWKDISFWWLNWEH